jgi:hypothetical protein
VRGGRRAAAAARLGRFASGRELLERVLADPAGAVFRPASPGQLAYYHDLPSGRLDDALRNVDAGCAALESVDPFGRLPYFLAFAAVIHEQRGELDDALAVAGRAREHAEAAGLSQWVGVVVATRTASIRAQLGDVAGAERDLALVPAGWRSGAWFVEVTRASVAAQRGDGQAALAAAERALLDVARWPYLDRTQCAELLAPRSRALPLGRARAIVEAAISASCTRAGPRIASAPLACTRCSHGCATTRATTRERLRHWSRRGRKRARTTPRRALRVAAGGAGAVGSARRRAIEPDAAIGAIAAARPGGAALGAFMAHLVPAAGAAVLTAVTAGHPDGYARALSSRRTQTRAWPTPPRRARARGQEPPPLAYRLGGFDCVAARGSSKKRRGAASPSGSCTARRAAAWSPRMICSRRSAPRPAASPTGAAVAIRGPRGAGPAGWGGQSARGGRARLSPASARRRQGRRDRVERAAEAALATSSDAGRGAALAAGAVGREPLPGALQRPGDPWRERLLDRYGEVLAAPPTTTPGRKPWPPRPRRGASWTPIH